MSPFWTIVVLLAILYLVLIPKMLTKFGSKRRDKVLALLSGLCADIVLFVILALSMTTMMTEDGYVLMSCQDGRVIANYNTFWRWDNLLDKYTLVACNGKEPTATMAVHPLTDNPKVRDFTYKVAIVVCDGVEATSTFYRNSGGLPPGAWLKSQLYEFQEQHSRELARFYNDVTQQRQFHRLLMRFLGPRLKKVAGRLDKASFRLPGNDVSWPDNHD